jgi:hypothetical protein
VLRSAAILLILPLAGCLNYRKVDDAKAPGDLLGVYEVEGELSESSCGKGALGAADSWEFEVKLSRFEHDIYWLNGEETIVGDIASDDRSFTLVSSVEVQVSEPGRGAKGCRVARHDTAKGRLSDSGTEVESFEGSLSFAYEAMKGSECDDWIGSAGAVSTLPCGMTYSLTAERSAKK